MKWEVITNERSSLQEFRLTENNTCKALIKYNPLHRSARITCDNQHRLFFLESAGSLSGKTILRNEYGLETGTISHDKFQPQEGSVVINATKYRYTIQNNPQPQLSIFEAGVEKPLAICTLPANKNNSSFFTAENTVNSNCYLIGICLFLSLLVVKEKSFSFANA